MIFPWECFSSSSFLLVPSHARPGQIRGRGVLANAFNSGGRQLCLKHAKCRVRSSWRPDYNRVIIVPMIIPTPIHYFSSHYFSSFLLPTLLDSPTPAPVHAAQWPALSRTFLSSPPHPPQPPHNEVHTRPHHTIPPHHTGMGFLPPLHSHPRVSRVHRHNHGRNILHLARRL